mgnify:CR=1 FL=1|jgi:gluconolactonase
MQRTKKGGANDLKADVLRWIMEPGQRWFLFFLPALVASMYFARGFIYTWPTVGHVETVDLKRMNEIFPAGEEMYLRAAKNLWKPDGPVWWAPNVDDPSSGKLFFSDRRSNFIFKLDNLAHTIYARGDSCGDDHNRDCGSSGIAVDPYSNKLLLCEQGKRQLSRLEDDGRKTALATHYKGKKLNGPNGILFAPNNDLLFLDYNDNQAGVQELEFNGIFKVRGKAVKVSSKNAKKAGTGNPGHDAKPELLSSSISMPAGMAFSNDHKQFLVSNSDPKDERWYIFDVEWDFGDGFHGSRKDLRILSSEVTTLKDFSLTNMREFASAGNLREECLKRGLPQGSCSGKPSGVKVDSNGNFFLTGPGGVHVYDSDGNRIGSLWTGLVTSNLEFGPGSLFITGDRAVIQIQCLTSPR